MPVDDPLFDLEGGMQHVESDQVPAHIDVLEQSLEGGQFAAAK